MPDDLVLVRHRESEGNVAAQTAKNGDSRLTGESYCYT